MREKNRRLSFPSDVAGCIDRDGRGARTVDQKDPGPVSTIHFLNLRLRSTNVISLSSRSDRATSSYRTYATKAPWVTKTKMIVKKCNNAPIFPSDNAPFTRGFSGIGSSILEASL